MEVEQENQIPFLDVLVRRNGDGTLGHRVYRKPPTLTGIFTQPPITIRHKRIQLSAHCKNIDQITKRLKNKISSPNDTETLDEEKVRKMTTVLPCLQGTTKRMGRILSKHNIKVFFKPQKKIAQVLPYPKDQRSSLETPDVYKIPCVCGKVYIEKTGKKISTQIKEHQMCAKYSHFSQSALAEHWMETGYTVRYDKFIGPITRLLRQKISGRSGNFETTSTATKTFK
ncbi:uncharacterized protein LOC105198119 [Solenopsis invicta]|uniref:uncharacterized protein LOC105198119 n=1 Tax=Solenopsis invicta TaxID=13686 RepID=UPI0005961A2B|nr:uncharacterized protein LOC105198119 [Solenopsis invicta]